MDRAGSPVSCSPALGGSRTGRHRARRDLSLGPAPAKPERGMRLLDDPHASSRRRRPSSTWRRRDQCGTGRSWCSSRMPGVAGTHASAGLCGRTPACQRPGDRRDRCAAVLPRGRRRPTYPRRRLAESGGFSIPPPQEPRVAPVTGYSSAPAAARPSGEHLIFMGHSIDVRPIRSGVHGGSNVSVTSTRSTPGTRSTALRTHSGMTSWIGQPGAVSVIVTPTDPGRTCTS